MTDKCKSKWSFISKSSYRRTISQNTHFIQGRKVSAKEMYTHLESFNYFFIIPQMFVIIVFILIVKLKQKKKVMPKKNISVLETCVDEIKTLVALLVLSAAVKNNHLTSNELFDRTLWSQWHKAGMSNVRFSFLLNYLHFDSKDTRVERKEKDKFDEKFKGKTDNWFTLILLAEKLQSNEFNDYRTVCKNKREIPPELLQLHSRNTGTAMYCFNKAKTLLSY